MSRLFPERLTVRLSPGELAFEKRETFACDPHYGAEPWQGAIAALRGIALERRTRVSVILANALVRYAVVPASDALDDEAEEQAYLRHHFARVHGERAKDWVFRWCEGLASAIDRRLLEALKASFPPKGKARLVSVQPALMTAINRWRGAFPAAGAWLVLAEQERACTALYAGRRWRSVANAKGGWLELLERERLRVEAPAPDLVLLDGAPPPAEAGGWTFRGLGT